MAAERDIARIQFHWRARVVFELMPYELQANLCVELDKLSAVSACGTQQLHACGYYLVKYESSGPGGVVQVLEIR